MNRHSTTPPELSAQFTLQGTNGYEIKADVAGRRQLEITALKFGSVIQSAVYSLRLHSRHGPEEIAANLGVLGRIDVRFVPRKLRREPPPKNCQGPVTVIEQGRFVGTIAFRGEEGFTEAHADHAAGAIARVPSYKCPPVGPRPNLKKVRRQLEKLEKEAKAEEAEAEEGDEEKALAVRLHAVAAGGRVTLTTTKTVLKEKHGKGLAIDTLLAVGTRRRGPIEESFVAGEIFGKGTTFTVPNRKDPKSEGILKPPAPFSGSATFRRHPKKPPTWTGDLEVYLPSFGEVRLTGPGTHASMCEGLACLLRDSASERTLRQVSSRR